MPVPRQARSAVHDGAKRRSAPLGEFSEDQVATKGTAGELLRLMPDAPAALWPHAILGMQRAVGNRTVARLLEPPAALTKTLGQEEELAKTLGQEEELAKATDAGRSGNGVAVVVAQTAPGLHPPTEPGAELLAKASTSVKSGAAASHALSGTVYGLTFPERVDASITATLNKAAGQWSPKVKSLKGHYSMQTRLLPGQTEITGPGGNTSSTNFCDQATNLQSLGNTVGNTWYMLSAVVRHEKVHAKHFGPALKTVEPAITANLEAITFPHVAGMTKAQAILFLKAFPTYVTEIVNAQQLWLAEILTRAAGDHASGGPTDKAEQKVTEPMRKKICRHAKKKKWSACTACP